MSSESKKVHKENLSSKFTTFDTWKSYDHIKIVVPKSPYL